jgi:aryl-alcohol dehydrogenase-like predicted oxidoreductase
MKTRRLGSLEVPTLGYGAMVLSPGMYGPIDDDTGIAALRHVVERGAGFVDTSDAYGHESHNEILIGRALKGWRDDVVVAIKFGFRFLREPQRTSWPPGTRAGGSW